MENLKKCPFCGSNAKLKQYKGVNTRFYVQCANINCLISTPYCETKEMAVRHWNTRPRKYVEHAYGNNDCSFEIMAEDLKLFPCPFCGGKHIFIRTLHNSDGINNTQYEVLCNNCSAKGGSRVEKLDAIEAWNRRTSDYNVACEHQVTYDNIDWSEKAKEALEKQIPKKPDFEGDSYDDRGNIIYDTWICPCCGDRYEVDYERYNHCPKCGQAIDWSEGE